ncbi:MAG: SGNH/GDSL hydrolase family protein, partial [Spirochaetia bacterium]|nr:SGNH/GDSL hydrolase family protein [Spirochaetia bacterium]
LFAASLTFARADFSQTASPVFQSGDRWVAIGDSITHGRRYHSFIYLFHATRYPEAPFQSFNCGISGDSASGAVGRFDWDIAPRQPTVATIMLGMNDVNRSLYGSQNGEAIETKRKEYLATHFDSMARLADRLKAMGCRLIFITPSIYDQTGTQTTENLFGVNDALGLCGEGAKKLAARIGGKVLELHDPMTALNDKLQKADANATLVGPDRVHPGDPGQLVMAYYLLKEMGVSGTVAEFTVDASSGKTILQNNCKVSDLKGTGAKLTFTCLEGSLPYPVLPAAEEALKWVPLMEELNREMLTVKGLPDGDYAVKVDGQTIAVFSAKKLGAGVNLARLAKSPMLKQSLAVMEVEEKRQSVAARMRTFAAQKHFLGRSTPGLDTEDFEAMTASLLKDLETKKNLPNYGYFKGQVDTYLTWKPREAELKKELEDQMAAVWKLNKPAPHSFEISPATASDSAATPVKTETSGKIIDEGDNISVWQKVPWSDTEPTMSISEGSLVVSAPRTAGRRDMLAIHKSVQVDLTGVKALKIRCKADAGAPLGVEVDIDGKLTRLRSYEKATGSWEEISLPITGVKLTKISLLLAESGKDEVWNAPTASYAFDRIWLE